MAYNYSLKDIDEKKTAKAAGVSIDISPKHAKMVCNLIRGENAEKAVGLLEAVIAKKMAVPYTENFRDLSHKTGIGPGRYPIKTTKGILAVLKSAIANAQHKGLSTSELVIKHISTSTAARPWRAGRHSRRKMKKAHLELILEQVGESKPAKKGARKQGSKKEAAQKDTKKAEPKEGQKKEAPSKDKSAPDPREKNTTGAN